MIEQRFFDIDKTLPATLNALAARAGVSFDPDVIERILADGEKDQVNEKRYTLYSSTKLTITGVVDEYEPDDILIRVESRLKKPLISD